MVLVRSLGVAGHGVWERRNLGLGLGVWGFFRGICFLTEERKKEKDE